MEYIDYDQIWKIFWKISSLEILFEGLCKSKH